MILAVTGASGFVGGALCRAAMAAGHDVLAYGRRPAVDSGHIGGAPYRSWDITGGLLPDPPQVDAVVHCAGSVTDWGDDSEIRRTNHEGTRAVLASFPNPSLRFVHVSTASVYDPYHPTVQAREDEAPVARYVNAYGASKAAAEREVCQRPGAWVILRPHAVYGPGDTTLLPRVLGAVRFGRLTAVGGGRQLVSLTAVGNLVQACLLAAEGPRDRGIFNVTDDAPVPLDWALRNLLAERGLKPGITYLPAQVAGAIATAAESAAVAWAWLARRQVAPPLTRYAVSHLAVERTLDITAARQALGYRPLPTSFSGAATW